MNVTQIRWFGQDAIEVAREGAIEVLFRTSEYLLAKANETVPIAEAILKDSGSAQTDEATLVATVSYNTPYAARQHEETTFRHVHGRAKWLQLTMEEQQQQIKDMMVQFLKGKFGMKA